MSRLRALGATFVWLVVVASVSALVWVVISRAGDGLVSSGQPLMTTEGEMAAPPRTPSARPSRTPSRTPSNDTSATSAPGEERRTWQGQAGSIVAACDATGIRLVSAQPANGFRAEVKDEDGVLRVEFEGREDQSGTDVSVLARCVGGVPSFSADRDD